MLLLGSDLDEPYVPFVTGRHSPNRIHEVRRRETGFLRQRRAIGGALIRAGRAIAARPGAR